MSLEGCAAACSPDSYLRVQVRFVTRVSSSNAPEHRSPVHTREPPRRLVYTHSLDRPTVEFCDSPTVSSLVRRCLSSLRRTCPRRSPCACPRGRCTPSCPPTAAPPPDERARERSFRLAFRTQSERTIWRRENPNLQNGVVSPASGLQQKRAGRALDGAPASRAVRIEPTKRYFGVVKILLSRRDTF